MYRAPIRGGRDAIGQAIGAGLAGGAASIASGLAERRRREEEEARLAEEKRRYEEQQRLAQEARDLALAQAGGRFVDESEAYDPIEASIAIPQMPQAEGDAGAPTPEVVAPARTVTMAGRGPRRENVHQVGERFVEFDPSRSMEFRTRDAQVQRTAAALQAADPTLSPEDAIAAAMGLDHLSFEEKLERRGRELAQSDLYNARSEARRGRNARSELTANQQASRRDRTVGGFAQRAVFDLQDRGIEDPELLLQGAENIIRREALEAGVELDDAEISRYATEAAAEVRRAQAETPAEARARIVAEAKRRLADRPETKEELVQILMRTLGVTQREASQLLR